MLSQELFAEGLGVAEPGIECRLINRFVCCSEIAPSHEQPFVDQPFAKADPHGLMKMPRETASAHRKTCGKRVD